MSLQHDCSAIDRDGLAGDEAAALPQQPHHAAGEVGGFLDKVLISIANNFEAEVKLRGKVKAAMTYPVVVLVMALLAVTVMLIFIVPVFAKMFEDLGGELPAPTQVLVFLSGWALTVLAISGVWVWGRRELLGKKRAG